MRILGRAPFISNDSCDVALHMISKSLIIYFWCRGTKSYTGD